MKRFEEKVAIITGGAQGIGEATTRRLANESAMTAILDIQLEKAQAVAEEILSQGGKKSIAVRMDITDSQEVKRAVREVEETFGRGGRPDKQCRYGRSWGFLLRVPRRAGTGK